jgi:predicted RNase H-like HicB family nuclease
MKRYHINVFWSDADKSWVADVPDLKTCSAFGDTPEEAVAEVKEAMDAWLAVARQEGHPIPKAAYRPAIYAAATAIGREARTGRFLSAKSGGGRRSAAR